MKIFIQILKGMLLWVTAFSTLCFVAGGCESFVEQGNSFAAWAWFAMNLILGYMCYCTITYKEFCKLSGSQLLNKLLGDGRYI